MQPQFVGPKFKGIVFKFMFYWLNKLFFPLNNFPSKFRRKGRWILKECYSKKSQKLSKDFSVCITEIDKWLISCINLKWTWGVQFFFYVQIEHFFSATYQNSFWFVFPGYIECRQTFVNFLLHFRNKPFVSLKYIFAVLLICSSKLKC